MAVEKPMPQEILQLLKPAAYEAWQKTCSFIQEHYEMEELWNRGGKAGLYEQKFRRGGKTLCAIYLRENAFGFMVVLGRAEQQKFEAQQQEFAPATAALYHETTLYHDGRWLMVEVKDEAPMADLEKLLLIKRRPNRKSK